MYCEQSAAAFAKVGVIVVGVLNDIRGGSILGEQSLRLLEMSKSSSAAARTEYVVHSTLFPWTKHWRLLLHHCWRDYDASLKAGSYGIIENLVQAS